MQFHLARDLKKHRRWLAIDSVLMVLFGVVLFAVPGPNIVGYYFAFRVVGHYLSFRGARQGLNAVSWTPRAERAAHRAAPAADDRPGPARAARARRPARH